MQKYHNLYQIVNDFAKTLDDSVFVNNEFDLEYFQTAYNVVSGRFDTVGYPSSPVTIDNRKRLGNRLISEYLNDFVDYWINIDENVESRVPDAAAADQYRAIKQTMFRLLRSFSIYKGTEFFIKFVYDLYATLTTTDFWVGDFSVGDFSVIFSNYKNLEYNLSGILPTYVWETVIKPTAHPAGWVCNYFGEDQNEDNEIVSYDNRLRNDYCYIDYAGCNETINNSVSVNFDVMEIQMTDLLRLNKVNFKFDNIVITTGGAVVVITEEER